MAAIHAGDTYTNRKMTVARVTFHNEFPARPRERMTRTA